MDEFTQSKKYWRVPTAQVASIVEVKKDNYKGVESAVVVFENSKGELIDGKFKLPMNEITKNMWNKLLKSSGAATGAELKGKKVGLQISVNEYNGKKYYQPGGYCAASLLISESEGTSDDGMGFETEGNLGF